MATAIINVSVTEPYTVQVFKVGETTDRFISRTENSVNFNAASSNSNYELIITKDGYSQGITNFSLDCSPTLPSVPECSVLINNNNIVSYYVPSTNVNTFLGSGFISSLDIAHTTTKLWMGSGTLINEYNITLSPWSASLNRNITSPTTLGAGLFAINNTTLISSDSSGVIKLDITGSTTVNTLLFSLPSGRSIAGDILVTTNDKVIVTTTGAGNSYISQYNYLTGALELELNITTTVPYPYGLFIDSGNIYICNNNGNIYNIDKNTPYALTLFNNSGIINIDGSSQPYSCGNASFVTSGFPLNCVNLIATNNESVNNIITFTLCDGAESSYTLTPGQSTPSVCCYNDNAWNSNYPNVTITVGSSCGLA